MMPCSPSRAGSWRAGTWEILLVVQLAWGCGDTRSVTSATPTPTPRPAPSPYVEPPVGFVIVAGMNVVRVGDTMPFTATVYPGVRPLPPPFVPDPPFDVTGKAEWVSSDRGVATVSSSGLVTIVGPGSAEISASYKGGSYALPLVAVERASSDSQSRYVGTWSGVAMTTCTILFGAGTNKSLGFSLSGQPPVIPQPAQLTLVLADDRLTGTLTLYETPTTGPVQAALLDTGELAVGGSIRSGEGREIIPLRDSRLTLTRRGQLPGACFQDRAFANVYGSSLYPERDP